MWPGGPGGRTLAASNALGVLFVIVRFMYQHTDHYNRFSPFSIFTTVCVWLACVCACFHAWGGCTCTWTCMWRPEVDIGYPPLSTLLTEAGSLSQTQSLPVWLVPLASSFWGGSCLCLSRLELQASCHVHLHLHEFWGAEL